MKMTEPSSTCVDPWLDCNCENGTDCFEDDFNPFVRMPDSKTYICALESKLARLKGQTTTTTSSASMLDNLVIAKDDHMSSLMSSDENYSDVSIPITLPMNFIRSRLCPERQALTSEELQALVSADHLSRALNRDDFSSGDNQSSVTVVQVQDEDCHSAGIRKNDDEKEGTT